MVYLHTERHEPSSNDLLSSSNLKRDCHVILNSAKCYLYKISLFFQMLPHQTSDAIVSLSLQVSTVAMLAFLFCHLLHDYPNYSSATSFFYPSCMTRPWKPWLHCPNKSNYMTCISREELRCVTSQSAPPPHVFITLLVNYFPIHTVLTCNYVHPSEQIPNFTIKQYGRQVLYYKYIFNRQTDYRTFTPTSWDPPVKWLPWKKPRPAAYASFRCFPHFVQRY
jgi:hypothetical protein